MTPVTERFASACKAERDYYVIRASRKDGQMGWQCPRVVTKAVGRSTFLMSPSVITIGATHGH